MGLSSCRSYQCSSSDVALSALVVIPRAQRSAVIVDDSARKFDLSLLVAADYQCSSVGVFRSRFEQRFFAWAFVVWVR